MALSTPVGGHARGGPRKTESASRRNQLPVPPDQYAAGPRHRERWRFNISAWSRWPSGIAIRTSS